MLRKNLETSLKANLELDPKTETVIRNTKKGLVEDGSAIDSMQYKVPFFLSNHVDFSLAHLSYPFNVQRQPL